MEPGASVAGLVPPALPYVPPAKPANEDRRLAELSRLAILDTAPEPQFDQIVAAAATLCHSPMAMISLIDAERQWAKAKVGFPQQEIPRTDSVCAHALLTPDRPLVLSDARQIRRFANHPFVSGPAGIRFYAGWPLVNDTGLALGTLCVLDTEPHDLNADQMTVMATLASNATRLMEARRAYFDLQAIVDRQERNHAELAQMAANIANNSETEEQAVSAMLDAIVSVLPAQSAHYLSADDGRLFPTKLWSGDGSASSSHRDAVRSGRGAPVVAATAASTATTTHSTDEQGNDVFCVPVLDGGRVAGVMTVHLGRVSSRSSLRLAGVLDQIALQIGRTVERERTARSLAYRSNHDLITGLANRAMVTAALDEAFASGTSDEMAVAFLDLDRFKLVNDSLGHAAGDDLLRQAAARLAERTRPQDVLARFGGDEFVLLCNRVTRPEVAEQVTRELLSALDDSFEIADQELFLSASAGIAVGRGHYTTGQLLADADAAMYRAKRRGSGVELALPGGDRAAIRQMLGVEAALRRAVDEHRIDVHYQPVVHTVAEAPEYLEALARWDREGHGRVPPDVFIPLAEQAGIIRALDECIRRRVMCQMREWDRDGGEHSGQRVGVNVSARELVGGFAGKIRDELLDAQVDPSRLVVEVTESAVLHGDDEAMTELRSLAGMGCRIAIDDFGIGYSSLSRLRTFPARYLKLAGELLTGRASDAPFLSGVRALAESLGLTLIVEGVETPEHWLRLRQAGAPLAQGFFLHPPSPA